MNDKIEKKYLEDKRRKYYGGTKNDALYLFRQSRKEDCMGTTQNLPNWEVLGSRFSTFIPQRQKSSIDNLWHQTSYPTIVPQF
jgi:predicted GH43/DUF377 family glycosyl hydrolase